MWFVHKQPNVLCVGSALGDPLRWDTYIRRYVPSFSRSFYTPSDFSISFLDKGSAVIVLSSCFASHLWLMEIRIGFRGVAAKTTRTTYD